MTNAIPSILAMTSGSTAVALYSPATAIESYYFGVANAINGLFLPMVSRIIADKRDDKLLKLMTKVGRYQTAILGLLLAGLFCIGDDFIINWMGVNFRPSYYCIILLCIPSFFIFSQQIGDMAIIAEGHVKEQAVLYAAATAFGLGLCYYLSKSFGAIGGAVSYCLTGALRITGSNLIYHKKIGINIQQFYKDCYIRMSIPILATCAAGRVFSTMIGDRGVLWLIIKIAAIAILYAVLLWLFALNKEEKRTVTQLIGRYLPGRRKKTEEE